MKDNLQLHLLKVKKEAAILEAEAESEAKIRRAAGEAKAIKEVAEAKAEEIQMVYECNDESKSR